MRGACFRGWPEGRGFRYRPTRTREDLLGDWSDELIDRLLGDFGDVAVARLDARLSDVGPAARARLREAAKKSPVKARADASFVALVVLAGLAAGAVGVTVVALGGSGVAGLGAVVAGWGSACVFLGARGGRMSSRPRCC